MARHRLTGPENQDAKSLESSKLFVVNLRNQFNHSRKTLTMPKLQTLLFPAIAIFLALSLLPVMGQANEPLLKAIDAYEARNFDSAISELQKLDESRDVLFHLALAQLRAGEFRDANETLETLHEGFPNDAEAWYLTGLVKLSLVGEVSIFRKVGMANETMEAWETSVSIDPDHLNSRYAIFAFYASAPGIAGGDIEKAKSMIPDLTSRDPGFGAMARGLISSKTDNHEATEAAFREAIVLLDRAGPHFALAQFFMEIEAWEKALAEIEQYHAKEKRWWDPDITAAHLITARAYAELGESTKAREVASLGLSLQPNDQIKGLLEDTLSEL